MTAQVIWIVQILKVHIHVRVVPATDLMMILIHVLTSMNAMKVPTSVIILRHVPIPTVVTNVNVMKDLKMSLEMVKNVGIWTQLVMAVLRPKVC